MSPRTTFRRRRGRDGEHGQFVVLFALCIVAIIAMAGLLIDGGMAWSNRRQAQAAADTGALAAAKAVVDGASATAAAQAVAGLNGFGPGTDCQGNALANNGVTVNRPPSTGPHSAANDPLNANNYVEVVTVRKMTTTFAGAVGQSCWMVSARAVASIGTSSVASCSFCSLNRSSKNHTLVLKNGATLRVDGDIYVNSSNGGYTPGSCVLNQWTVCGDGFDIFGAGGLITARTISVNGGWETHDNNPTQADFLVPGCETYDPPSQTAPYIPSRVCIHMPQIADPLNDPLTPKNIIAAPPDAGKPVAGVNGCPAGALIPSGTAGSPSTLTITSTATLCPGTYYGGVKINTGGSVTMMPGVYYIAGGGFAATGSGSVNGTAGVMIYNSSGSAAPSDTQPGVDPVPTSGAPKKVKNPTLKANPNNPSVGQTVTLTFEVDRNGGGTPTGTMDFFDGSTKICAAIPVVDVGGGTGRGTCTYSWTTYGTKSVSAIYYGDATYQPAGDATTVTVAAPAGSAVAPINIQTTGAVQLYGPTSGNYKGLTIFQERSSALTVTLAPGGGSAALCSPAPPSTPNWLTIDVPHVTGPPPGSPPPACGAIGGLRGTVYAANESALVFITASGLANLQVIAGKIQVDSGASARFAFTPQFFANGNIRLVE